ncbi:MAG TPA: hypothetical protein VMW58_02905 [Anaerolineae bacterium]|nr:hypothetical protein [Anaerolineae bacterium]
MDDIYTRAVTPPEAGGDLEQYAKTLGGLEHAFGVLLAYQDIVFRGVYMELNALVELELKCLAASIMSARGEEPGPLNRGSARTIIEREYGISLRDLPRHDEIDEIRNMANAYKHDDGFSGTYEEIATSDGTVVAYRESKYKLSWDKASQSIQAVHEFMKALPGERQPFPEFRQILVVEPPTQAR